MSPLPSGDDYGRYGDVYQPERPKNQHLRGKKVIVPLVGREIPVIEDDYVDIEFGTGCLKVTPAHDVNDYMLGEKYNLLLSIYSTITVR